MGSKSQGDVPAPLYEVLSKIVVTFAEDMKREPATAERLIQLVTNRDRALEALRLVHDLTPARVDQEQFLDWLERRSAPITSFDLPEPPSTKSPRGQYQMAEKRRGDICRRIESLEAQLASEKTLLAEADATLETADAALRVYTAWLMLREINQQAAGAFAMGPAWSLMRIASGHLATDPEFEERLGDRRAAFEEFKASKGSRATQLLTTLDMFCGDIRFELKMHEALVKAAEEYLQKFQNHVNEKKAQGKPLTTAEKRVRRKIDEQKASLHPQARSADRHEVLNGFEDAA